MKKKVSLLMALAMCGTIGGVYATWYYQEGTIQKDTSLVISLTSSKGTGKGTLNVATNNLVVNIDDKIDSTYVVDYHGELVVSGSIVLEFTPDENVDEEVKDGIDLKVTLDFDDSWTYTFAAPVGEQKVFNVEDTKATFTITDADWTEQNGVLVTEIKPEHILAYLSLNTYSEGKSVVYLPSQADYNAFAAEIVKKGFSIDISDAQNS